MKHFLLPMVLLTMLTLTFCTTSKNTASSKGKKMPAPAYTYTGNIAPILQERCTPCHFPGGRVKFLDTYGAVSSNIDDIIRRIELPRDSVGFMPFKAKKEPLSDSLIMVIKTWKETGMAN